MLIFLCVLLFHSQLTQLGLGYKSHYTFCRDLLWFQCQFSFQRPCGPFWVLPMCVPPKDQSGTQAVTYIVVYVSNFGVLFHLIFMDALLREKPQDFTHSLTRSSSFLLFVISLKLPNSQVSFLLVLHPTGCGFSILLLSYPLLGQIGNLDCCCTSQVARVQLQDWDLPPEEGQERRHLRGIPRPFVGQDPSLPFL